MKLSKVQVKAHDEAMALVALERDLTDSEKEFVLDNFHEGATHMNSAAGAFFTPRTLARDFAIEVQGRTIVDLCAGIGGLAHAVIHNYLVLIPQRLYSCGGIHNALQTDPYCFDAGFAVTLAS